MHAIALTTAAFFYIRGNSLISSWPGVITSIWWLYSLKNLLLFSVVLYICSLSLYFSKPFSTMTVRYSFSSAYDRNALYIILAWVAPPPSPPPSFAASSICATMSVQLLYLIAKHSKNDVNEHYDTIFCKQKPDVEPFMQYYPKSLSFKACWLIVLQVISSPRAFQAGHGVKSDRYKNTHAWQDLQWMSKLSGQPVHRERRHHPNIEHLFEECCTFGERIRTCLQLQGVFAI